jgi:hypothetical protein
MPLPQKQGPKIMTMYPEIGAPRGSIRTAFSYHFDQYLHNPFVDGRIFWPSFVPENLASHQSETLNTRGNTERYAQDFDLAGCKPQV